MAISQQSGRVLPAQNMVVFSFGQDAVAASQTDQALARVETSGGTTSVTSYEMPFAGEVVAVAATVSAAATAGTLTVKPTIAGTAVTDPNVALTTAAAGTATVDRDNTKGFSAGDAIGVEITTDGSWDATTSDLAVDVYVFLFSDDLG